MKSELEYINVILEYGSLSKAAKALGVTQPAISMRINKLEESRGIVIFDRDKTPVVLTDEGELYVEYLKKKDVVEKDLNRKLTFLRDSKKQKLTVGGPNVYVESIVVEVMPEFRRMCPDCEVDVINGSQTALMQRALEGGLDFFICTSDKLTEEFVTREIGTERLMLCLPKGMIDEENSLDKPAILSEYSLLDGREFIFLEKDQPLQMVVNDFLAEYRITPKNVMRVNQVITGIKLASKTGCIFIASRDALLASKMEDKFDICAMPEKFTGRRIYAARNKVHEVSPNCHKFVELAQNMLR